MIVIEIWQMRYFPEVQISITENDEILKREKFHFRRLSAENQSELNSLLSELRNHFGFKLVTDNGP